MPYESRTIVSAMGEKQPYKLFGEKLRSLRERAKESLYEVSGAVEIDETTLSKIESGRQLPDEEILALLMSHFDASEKEALNLWELAGYSKDSPKDMPFIEDQLKQIMMVIPFDNRVAFSDIAHISANKKGVVIEFGLSGGNTVPQTVSKIGMSLEQAQTLSNQLTNSIHMARRPKVIKALPAPKQPRKKKRS